MNRKTVSQIINNVFEPQAPSAFRETTRFSSQLSKDEKIKTKTN